MIKKSSRKPWKWVQGMGIEIRLLVCYAESLAWLLTMQVKRISLHYQRGLGHKRKNNL
jgi:hypothetical protein